MNTLIFVVFIVLLALWSWLAYEIKNPMEFSAVEELALDEELALEKGDFLKSYV
ncbi:hypothetical protein H8S90_08410 [Olivibacter sp. SDN3]|uniref:hypothetical protein n=1 Tax=Olivibacter sp. SDN3 TaxID=2764720 RepID=UPI0016515BA0|nr:hypothetical protein [Olivibacter sp. SDN3]QNL51578.1 hypothetical protein H8S90_08410 [Olivibacter sp. SDN3]